MCLTTRQLLEDHLKKLREEETGGANDVDGEDDDADAWEGWDVETDSDSESEPEGWIDVDSEGDNNLEVSDSEDEQQSSSKPLDDEKPEADANPNRISTLATTKVSYSFYTSYNNLTLYRRSLHQQTSRY
jgi:protein SDA1